MKKARFRTLAELVWWIIHENQSWVCLNISTNHQGFLLIGTQVKTIHRNLKMQRSSEEIKYLQAMHGFQVIGVTFALPQTPCNGQKNPTCFAKTKSINYPGSLPFTEAQFPQQEVPSRRAELNSPGATEQTEMKMSSTEMKNSLGHLAGSEACSVLSIHQFGQFILPIHQFLLISTQTFQQHTTKDFSLNRDHISFLALSNIYECLFSTCLTPIALTWLL